MEGARVQLQVPGTVHRCGSCHIIAPLVEFLDSTKWPGLHDGAFASLEKSLVQLADHRVRCTVHASRCQVGANYSRIYQLLQIYCAAESSEVVDVFFSSPTDFQFQRKFHGDSKDCNFLKFQFAVGNGNIGLNMFANQFTTCRCAQLLKVAILGAASIDPNNITIITLPNDKWYDNITPLIVPFPNTHVITYFPLNTVAYKEPTILAHLNIEPYTETAALHHYCIHHKNSPISIQLHNHALHTILGELNIQ